VPDNYVPAAPSTMKNLEDALVRAANRFPEIADRLLLVTTQVSALLSTIDREHLPERAGQTLTRASEVLVALQSSLKQADIGHLSAGAQQTIAGLNRGIAHLDAMLSKMDGEQGLLVSAQRATDSVGDLAGGAKGMGADLSDTLRDVRDAVESIQRLSDALETDSDMLLKGRAKGRPQ
jgi:paraquat-inducible protein B